MVKPGYKQTEVGVIPEDWEVVLLKRLVSLVIDNRGKTPPLAVDGHPLIEVNAICGIDRTPNLNKITKFVDQSTYESWFRRGHPKTGDILIATVGTAGASVIIVDDLGCIAQNIVGLRFFKSCCADFVFQFTQTESFLTQVRAVLMGAVQPSLKVPHLLGFSVPLPPTLPDQQAIATALSDADELIGSLEKLIAKKRQIKQGAMQELLNGKKRLPGFTGEWAVKRLKEVAEITAGINKPVTEMGSGALYVTVQDVYDGVSINTDRLGRIRLSPEEIQTKSLNRGDIVFGKSSVKREGIGYPSQFLGCDEPVVFSGFTYRARARGGIADATYLFYSLRLNETRRWLIDNSQASALTNINQSIADSIPVRIPPSLHEQTAIAEVLSDMDAEIESLETKLAKARLVKQGMMQELLTGNIRLV